MRRWASYWALALSIHVAARAVPPGTDRPLPLTSLRWGHNLTESVKVKCSFRIFLNTVPPKQLLSVHQGLARMHFLHSTELLGHKLIHLVTPRD